MGLTRMGNMNSHDLPERDTMDLYLRRSLQHWASRPAPPVNGRKRLLWSVITGRCNRRTERTEQMAWGDARADLLRAYGNGSHGLLAQAMIYSFRFSWTSLL